MYYRLKPSYALRGWEKMAWVLVHRPDNRIRYLNQEEFQTLFLCDGATDFNEDYISEEMRQALRRFEEEGIVEPCAAGETLDADQFYQYYNNRYVQDILWSITGRCNFRCRHCYMDAPEGTLGELTHAEALDLIDQMAECGVLRVSITGGEPFVRRDFWELIDRILAHKITIGQVYTNGWLLNEAVLDAFAARGLRPEFCISFDGIGWHDWMRGVKGAEEAALKALRLCKARGFPTNAQICVHKGNLDTLPDTVRILGEAGVQYLIVANVDQTELWQCNAEGKELSPQEYYDAMLRYIPRFFEAGMPMGVMLAGVVRLGKDSKQYEVLAERFEGTEDCLDCHLCGAARFFSYITPEGRLLPCLPMTSCEDQSRFPRVQDIGLKMGLSQSFYMEFVDRRVKDLLAANPKCAACPYVLKCGGGCRASALMDGDQDLMGSDPKLCILWREGYVERIHQTTDAAIALYCR